MIESRLYSLEEKHKKLEAEIHQETRHAARNDTVIRQLKEKKLLVREEIEQLREALH